MFCQDKNFSSLSKYALRLFFVVIRLLKAYFALNNAGFGINPASMSKKMFTKLYL